MVIIIIHCCLQVRFEDDVTDDVVVAEEFVDEDDYFQFIQPFRLQVSQILLFRGTQFTCCLRTGRSVSRFFVLSRP